MLTFCTYCINTINYNKPITEDRVETSKCYFDKIPDEILLRIFTDLQSVTDTISFVNSLVLYDLIIV